MLPDRPLKKLCEHCTFDLLVQGDTDDKGKLRRTEWRQSASCAATLMSPSASSVLFSFESCDGMQEPSRAVPLCLRIQALDIRLWLFDRPGPIRARCNFALSCGTGVTTDFCGARIGILAWTHNVTPFISRE
ncbi:hypothetical protein PAHAL_2G487500 [Panicum hallii]|uniref:Uncharacterized protein n=1 Tax=Panicum hallii TaxID=206008 RepID=A0A2T8KTC3_9POAL|nr:hypothetical protein PAHAL_2G487500 [Panicum hallii]